MNLRSDKGFSLVEMIMVMFLIGILGTMVMKFMINGSAFYKKVYTYYDARNEARLAVHCITSRIRQNDAVDTIYIKDNRIRIIPKDDNNKIKDVSDIFYDDIKKKLYEGTRKITKADITKISENKSIDYTEKEKRKIGEISSFKAEANGTSIEVSVGYTDSSKVEKIYTETLTLRSFNK